MGQQRGFGAKQRDLHISSSSLAPVTSRDSKYELAEIYVGLHSTENTQKLSIFCVWQSKYYLIAVKCQTLNVYDMYNIHRSLCFFYRSLSWRRYIYSNPSLAYRPTELGSLWSCLCELRLPWHPCDLQRSSHQICRHKFTNPPPLKDYHAYMT